MAHDVVLSEQAVATLDGLEDHEADRVRKKLQSIADFPGHFLDRSREHPGYKLRVGDHRVLVDWDKDAERLYAIDVFERKKDHRELGKHREVWGSWREGDAGEGNVDG